MEARMLRDEEELRMTRRQAAPPARDANREPLYERFRKHHPPTFEGGTDLLKVEQWLDLLTSILEFMGVEGNDRVGCVSHMLRDGARIW